MPEIFDTPTSRVIEGRVFPKHAKSTAQPPPELLREVEAENLAAERSALLTKMENPIQIENNSNLQMEHFTAWCEPYVNSDWCERETPANQKPLFATLKTFFWSCRNLPGGGINAAGVRDQFLLRIGYVPFLKVEGLTAREKIDRLSAKGGVFATPGVSVNQEVQETFPLALMTLSLFLKKFKPCNDFDITPLQEISAVDVGHEDTTPYQPEKTPSMAELMQALATALKPKAT